MKTPKYDYYVGDFETTVYDGQDSTEVWASAIVPFYSEDVTILHSIDDTFKYLISLDTNIVIYYHNLKFDGAFWLDYLMLHTPYTHAFIRPSSDLTKVENMKDADMPPYSFRYVISDMGQWYTIIIKTDKHYIQIRDSLKLLPFKLKRIGESFKTKHRKLSMEYEGYRYAGCEITDEEKHYIANDVLVIKEALEIMYEQGHKELTIGSCCLKEFLQTVGDEQQRECMFPDLYAKEINESVYGSPTAGDYIRKSYKGAWCYVVEGCENTPIHNGLTCDVNSLYPSMMSSESGNYYPIGFPTFWKGNFIPMEALLQNRYYFLRIRTRFYLKTDMLPCIQVKHNFNYNSNEWLKSSDVYNPKNNKYYPEYIDIDGTRKQAIVEMTLTMTDFKLIKDHYNLVDFEILDGCWFDTDIGIFDSYIEKYKKIKMENKGALRELAKLFLNNLYGKMASSKKSSFKYAVVKEDGVLGFIQVPEYNKKAGYIPIGSAITSYARNFTIRTAQLNYHGKGKRGFKYADTDSIHCDLKVEELKGVHLHPTNFCCWKAESSWDLAIFVRQKTYIEHIIAEDLQPISTPYYNIKCAGMPDRCKDLYRISMGEKPADEDFDMNKLSEEEKEFISQKRTLEDFKVGLVVPSKLTPKRVKGGIILQKTTYEMR